MKCPFSKLLLTKKILLLILFCKLSIHIYSQEKNTLISLEGEWLFTLSDQNLESVTSLGSENWSIIKAPGNWESQGYNGYNGNAWYKKEITIPISFENKRIGIELGYIDDVDEVYINGNLIGYSGSFPPNFSSAYNSHRVYNIPSEFIMYDSKNVILIRIFDSWGEGGIVGGKVRIFEYLDPFPLDIDLQGIWKFKKGDNQAWKEPGFIDKDWEKILVPANWENMGHKYHDGFAWYRKTFLVASDLLNQDFWLTVGKIDDLDQTYINGILVGSIGRFSDNVKFMPTQKELGPEWSKYRIYKIPKTVLNKNGVNTISIRVYDILGGGGIYQGPVGLVSNKTYLRYRLEKNLK